MRQKVRAALDVVEDVLMQGGRDGEDLAAIISALRGPDDDEDTNLKSISTIPIRQRAFPRLAAHSSHKVGWAFGREPKPLPPMLGSDIEYNHFRIHINDAVAAIQREDDDDFQS